MVDFILQIRKHGLRFYLATKEMTLCWENSLRSQRSHIAVVYAYKYVELGSQNSLYLDRKDFLQVMQRCKKPGQWRDHGLISVRSHFWRLGGCLTTNPYWFRILYRMCNDLHTWACWQYLASGSAWQKNMQHAYCYFYCDLWCSP